MKKIKALFLSAVLLAGGAMSGCTGGGADIQGEVSTENSTPYPPESSPTAEGTEQTAPQSPEQSRESFDANPATEEAPPVITPIDTEPDYEWDKVIALTFDDGPNTDTTPEVLDMLEKHHIVASFFLIGNNINDESAESVKRAYALGCEINNHSKSHDYMDKMSADDIKAEYDYVDEKVFELTGEHTKFFRPPYIAVSDEMWENIDVPFISGIGCNDWDEKVTVEKRVQMILKKAADGCIILMHDASGNHMTVEAIDQIIPELKAQGYKFVTVSELFKENGITPTSQMIYTNVTQEGMWG